MDKNSTTRWTILSSALCATLAAIWYPTTDTATVSVSPAAPRVGRPKATVAESFGLRIDDGERDAPAGDVDPFAPRGWQAPPPPAPVTPAQPLIVAPVILAPAGPPELPFRFVGNFNDGAEQITYLARGEQALVARLGDVVDSNYKVVGLSSTQIEFEYLPTGDKQLLAFPAHDN